VPLYPAREEPIKGISSEIIFDKMKLENKYLIGLSEVPELLKRNSTDIIMTMGAGDIDGIAEQIIEVIKSKN
jgi:UDP-N-acetylmuramate--alanine ligase